MKHNTYDLWFQNSIAGESLTQVGTSPASQSAQSPQWSHATQWAQQYLQDICIGESALQETCVTELSAGLNRLLDMTPHIAKEFDPTLPCQIALLDTWQKAGSQQAKRFSPTLQEQAESFQWVSRGETLLLASASAQGLLYGIFQLLRDIACGKSLDNYEVFDYPHLSWRILNHWDNLDGTIERGYAGNSLWKWDELPNVVDTRYTDYARACASIGINGTVVNNVNTQPEILSDTYIEKVATLANVFRKYGIRTFLSVNFGSPVLLGNLDTADPLDKKVIAWWKERIEHIYTTISDFGGFIVKADSEGQPGPFSYGRDHTDGANMLARLLEPKGGLLIWRAFVYGQGEKDRAASAYNHFMPFDGKFHTSAVLQVKNGPIDFQPREPVSPLFGAMDHTNVFMEFQITQEYLGQGNHIVYLAPMWKEILTFDTGKPKAPASSVVGDCTESDAFSQPFEPASSVVGDWLSDTSTRPITGIAAVTNIGNNTNWCGSSMHQLNWYAYGRLAWNYTLEPESILDEWLLQSLPLTKKGLATCKKILLSSWETCIDYMTPLGLNHIMKEGHHYGPDPGYNECFREDWNSTYYHRADSEGLGFDRSPQGSGAVLQYFSKISEQWRYKESCPEKYLLWFHHVPWEYTLSSGRTLWQELQFRYNRGVTEVQKMQELWGSLAEELPKSLYEEIQEKLAIQYNDAVEWRDVCLQYFATFYQNHK